MSALPASPILYASLVLYLVLGRKNGNPSNDPACCGQQASDKPSASSVTWFGVTRARQPAQQWTEQMLEFWLEPVN